MGTEKLLQREKSATSKVNAQFELPFATILWSHFFSDAAGAEEVALASCPCPEPCLTSIAVYDLYMTCICIWPVYDLFQFIIGSFRTLLHDLSFLSLTGWCTELYSPKRCKNVIKTNAALDALLELWREKISSYCLISLLNSLDLFYYSNFTAIISRTFSLTLSLLRFLIKSQFITVFLILEGLSQWNLIYCSSLKGYFSVLLVLYMLDTWGSTCF